jgi:phosphoglucosamine mutase
MILNMTTKPSFFGTDGIRGVAGEFPLDHATILKIGSALGTVLKNSYTPARVVLGKDTRESNEWISTALASGLARTGAQVVDAGIITTPGVAFLTRQHEFSAGVMVSASHNPYQDNGIKIFSPAGAKLVEAQELEIESLIKVSSGIAGRRRGCRARCVLLGGRIC